MSAIRLAIDFDSAYTSIYAVGGSMVLREPTVAAVSLDGKNDIKAFGTEAKKLLGKTAENTKTVFPVFEGEIVNEEVAEKLLSFFLKKIGVSKFTSCRAVCSVPCGATADMISKYGKVFHGAGVGKTDFVEAPMLSAIGQRIPLSESSPCFVIDMAGGTTNIAALSLDGIIAGISVNFGINKISTDIIDFVAETNGLQTGLLTAERLRDEIGSLKENDVLSTVVNGRDLKTGTPRSISLKAVDIAEPIKKYYDKIASLALAVLKKLPPEVSAEIRLAGIYVSGGGSAVYGLADYYREKFGMQINIAENGIGSVAFGGGVALGNDELLKKIRIRID